MIGQFDDVVEDLSDAEQARAVERRESVSAHQPSPPTRCGRTDNRLEPGNEEDH